MELNNPSKFPFVLLGAYALLCAVLAFNPYDRPTWFVENLTVWIIVGILAFLYARGIRFSNTSYAMMSVLIFLHTIGGHFTFERVPFGFIPALPTFPSASMHTLSSSGFAPSASWRATSFFSLTPSL